MSASAPGSPGSGRGGGPGRGPGPGGGPGRGRRHGPGRSPAREPGPLRRLLAGVRSLAAGIFRRGSIEDEMLEEFEHHIALRTEDLVREGVPRTEAERRARVEFGHQESHREAGRAARGLGWVDQLRFSWVDVRLGLRLLWKHPWLTGAAGFALAIGIPLGLAPGHLARVIEAPLPADFENRVRAVRLWDPVTTGVSAPTYAQFEVWRDQLTSFESLAAFGSGALAVGLPGAPAQQAPVARVTASAFGVLELPPLMGRTLIAADEAPDAPAAVVVGEDFWRARLGADPAILGSELRVGGTPHTVVGVMPSGFTFPGWEQLWVPLTRGVSPEAADRMRVQVMGRLADGVGEEAAHAEVSAIPSRGTATAAVRGDERAGPGADGPADLRAEVVPFPFLFLGMSRSGLAAEPGYRLFQMLALVLLLVASGNAAMLIFARNATRLQELAVRSALGAGRGRIVGQMFGEALVLALVSCAIGVFGVDWLIGRIDFAAIAGAGSLPYWLSLDVTLASVAWAVFFAVVSAAVVGVLPALRLSRSALRENMSTARRAGGTFRFGGVTGALVIADVALSIAVVGMALGLGDRMLDTRDADYLAGIVADEVVGVDVRMAAGLGQATDAEAVAAARERFAMAQRELVARLEAEPGVRGVAVGSTLPRMDHRSRMIRIEGVEPSEDAPGWYVRSAMVDVGFFDALDAPVLSGRGFGAADLVAPRSALVVNAVFVDRYLPGRDPIGHRVQLVGTESEAAGGAAWMEIVGVVGHLGANMVNPAGDAAIYVPVAPGELSTIQLGVAAGPDAAAIAPRIREIALSVDPDLVVGAPALLSEVHQGDWYLAMGVTTGLSVFVIILIALAASGIYAMMSFSVTQRTREIGIRNALGASRSALVRSILRRSLLQIGIGAALGIPLAARLLFEMGQDAADASSPILATLTAVALALGTVMVVGLASCLAPTRRALAVPPRDALSSDA